MKKRLLSVLCMSLILLTLVSCGKKQVTYDPKKSNAVSAIMHEAEERKKPPEKISLVCFGDTLMHMPVVNSGKKADGTYDYSDIFEKLQPMIEEADLAEIGQETVFGGKKLGYSGYPLFNTPSDVGKSLVDQGFDIVVHASNHVLDKGTGAVQSTIDFWKQYPDVAVLGINETESDYNKVRIIEKKGAKIALLNYTYGTNGIKLAEEKAYMVNYIDEEKIKKDCEYARENADFTIAFMHWGTEYSSKVSQEQKELAKKMCTWGVGLIVGAHPHVIEPVEWIESDNGNKMLVYYSLGNFVSRQLEAKNLLGGCAKITLEYDRKEVKITDDKFMPVVTHYNKAYNKFTVYPLKDYSDDIAKEHGVAASDGAISVKRYKDMVDTVFDGYDKSIIDY